MQSFLKDIIKKLFEAGMDGLKVLTDAIKAVFPEVNSQVVLLMKLEITSSVYLIKRTEFSA